MRSVPAVLLFAMPLYCSVRFAPVMLLSVSVSLASAQVSASSSAPGTSATAAAPAAAGLALAGAMPAQPSDDPAALTALARHRMADGDDGEAVRLLQRALEISPNHPAANLALGDLWLRQKHLPEAMERFETVLRIERDPAAQQGELAASTQLALAASHVGDTQAAYRCLEHAAEFLPDSTELLTDLGLVSSQLHRYDRAREVLQHALTVEPNRAATLYALARAEFDADHLADAEKQFRAYLAAKPDDATAWFGLGRALHRQERDPEAEEALRRSVALQPVQTESYYELGAIALDGGRDAEAQMLFAKTLSRSPKHGGALTGMGEIRYRARDSAWPPRAAPTTSPRTTTSDLR